MEPSAPNDVVGYRQVRPTEARFPRAAGEDGLYESFYIRAGDPLGEHAVWIRYTVLKRPGGDPVGSLWFTWFDRAGNGPAASKVSHPKPRAGAGQWIEIGAAQFGPGRLAGRARTEALDARWELAFSVAEPPVYHLPQEDMYSGPYPPTKVLTVHPVASFTGSINLGDSRIEIDEWLGMIGHNWGSAHPWRGMWIYGIASKRDWLDVVLGKLPVDGGASPWLANGVVCVDGERYRIGGAPDLLEADVEDKTERCEFTARGQALVLRAEAGAGTRDFVGWVYTAPDGAKRQTINSSVANLRWRVERHGRDPVGCELIGRAALEQQLREPHEAVPVQPFDDPADRNREFTTPELRLP